ncbi:MAG: hypothetical protein IE909_01090 [Campylobacterales bacterium]|nr:hypothetical protein [Campylobacterales bacterium]
MKVLLTGSTGYISRRLKQKLFKQKALSKLEVVQGNSFGLESLKIALTGIDTAYYLIHSLNKDDCFTDLVQAIVQLLLP